MRNSSGHSLVELGVGAFLLVIVALLSANVYVLYLGKAYNDRVCRDSIDLGARVALEGKPTEAVQKAARAGMDSCGYGGIFIGHPQYTAFQDENTTEVRVLKLQTQTLVNLPVAFLCPGRTTPKVVFTSNYEYQIKNPKKAETDQPDAKSDSGEAKESGNVENTNEQAKSEAPEKNEPAKKESVKQDASSLAPKADVKSAQEAGKAKSASPKKAEPPAAKP